MVEFDLLTTMVAFLLVTALGVGGLIGAGFMDVATTLMMVAPSMLVYGGICLALGAQYGEHTAGS